MHDPEAGSGMTGAAAAPELQNNPTGGRHNANAAAARGALIVGRRSMDIACLEDRVRRAMSGLRALGVAPGDSVALLLRNDVAFVEADAAIERIGACSVPLNWHAKADEIGAIMVDAEVRVVVVHADLKPLLAAMPAGVKVIVVETPDDIAEAYRIRPDACRAAANDLVWESWLAAQTPDTGPREKSRGAISYSSGTTGVPKGIQRLPFADAAQAALNTERQLRINGIRPGVRALISGPLYHSMQMSNMRKVVSAIGETGVVVIEPRFDPERLLRLIDEHRITQMLLVPIMFVRLLRLPEAVRKRYDVSSLEWVVHSAAPCPFEVKKQMIAWWGPVIHEFYALTETGPVTLVGSDDYLRKPGTVGRACPGCIVKVLDDGGREQSPSCLGEVAAVNTLLPDFTYRNRAEERAKLDRNGLIATGDIGYLDEEGFLFLCDRKKDMVISGGVNIFPSEIEAVLLGMPGIKDCAVFGIPDDEYGEVLAAQIEPLEGASLDENKVREHLRKQVSGLKVPRIYRFDRGLPRDDNGKINKRRLAEPYWSAVGRRISGGATTART